MCTWNSYEGYLHFFGRKGTGENSIFTLTRTLMCLFINSTVKKKHNNNTICIFSSFRFISCSLLYSFAIAIHTICSNITILLYNHIAICHQKETKFARVAMHDSEVIKSFAIICKTAPNLNVVMISNDAQVAMDYLLP